MGFSEEKRTASEILSDKELSVSQKYILLGVLHYKEDHPGKWPLKDPELEEYISMMPLYYPEVESIEEEPESY